MTEPLDENSARLTNGNNYEPTILDNAAQAAYNKQQTEEIMARTKGPVFNQKPDKIGLPMESPAYASHKCKKCWSKGYYVQHLKEPLMIPQAVGPAEPHKKFYNLCECTNKGYSKLRLKTQEFLDAGMDLETAARKAGFKGDLPARP